MRQMLSVLLWLSICWIHCSIPWVHSSTLGPCMNVRTRMTFFFGDLNPATSSLSVRYFSTSFINVSALLLSPWKVGGSFPMALTFAAVATGWFAVPPAAAGPPPLCYETVLFFLANTDVQHLVGLACTTWTGVSREPDYYDDSTIPMMHYTPP